MKAELIKLFVYLNRDTGIGGSQCRNPYFNFEIEVSKPFCLLATTNSSAVLRALMQITKPRLSIHVSEAQIR